MTQQYIGDNHIIVALQGLRWVSKYDKYYGHESYSLEVQYKGANKQVKYPDAETRDAMYYRILEALESNKKAERSE